MTLNQFVFFSLASAFRPGASIIILLDGFDLAGRDPFNCLFFFFLLDPAYFL